jgi:hypothetical protein
MRRSQVQVLYGPPNIKIMYCILKIIKSANGVDLPVVLLDTLGEVWEFEDADEAIKMAEILTKNSDSGHRYYVKKV